MNNFTFILCVIAFSSWLVAGISDAPLHFKCQTISADNSDIATTDYIHLVKSIKIPSETTYRYIISKPSEINKPWLLFLHGFPSSSYDWRHQVEYFTRRGYGVIAPDLLGYGGTDNPSDLNRFSMKNIILELQQLLDCEGIDTVFAIGHDYGSVVLSRFITYMPERLQAVAFVDVGYSAPPIALDQAGVELINNATLASLGYPIFGYWYFMNDDNVSSVMDDHLDSAYTLTYTWNSTWMQLYFSPVGEYERFLLEDRIAPWGKFIDEENKKIFRQIIETNGGFDGPVKGYKALMRGINAVDEAGKINSSWKTCEKKEELASSSLGSTNGNNHPADTEAAIPSSAAMIPHPVLILPGTEDKVALPEMQVNNTVPYASNIRVRPIKAGHWVQLEQAEQVNFELEGFITDVLYNITLSKY